jgi:hypothetical protein
MDAKSELEAVANAFVQFVDMRNACMFVPPPAVMLNGNI